MITIPIWLAITVVVSLPLATGIVMACLCAARDADRNMELIRNVELEEADRDEPR